MLLLRFLAGLLLAIAGFVSVMFALLLWAMGTAEPSTPWDTIRPMLIGGLAGILVGARLALPASRRGDLRR